MAEDDPLSVARQGSPRYPAAVNNMRTSKNQRRKGRIGGEFSMIYTMIPRDVIDYVRATYSWLRTWVHPASGGPSASYFRICGYAPVAWITKQRMDQSMHALQLCTAVAISRGIGPNKRSRSCNRIRIGIGAAVEIVMSRPSA